MPAPHTVWTEQENRLVAQEALRLLEEHHQLNPLDAVRQAVPNLDGKVRQKPVPQYKSAIVAFRLMEKLSKQKIMVSPKGDAKRTILRYTRKPAPEATPQPDPLPASLGPQPKPEPSPEPVPKFVEESEREEDDRLQQEVAASMHAEAINDGDMPGPGHPVEDFHPAPRRLPYQELPDLHFPTREEMVQGIAAFVEEAVVVSIKRVLTNPDVARMLRVFVHQEMPSAVFEERRATPRHDPHPTQAAKAQLPSVLVAGILPHNYPALQQAVKDRLNLKFFYDGGGGGGASIGSLRDKLNGVAMALYSMDNSSHQHVDTAKKANVRALRVTGGTTTMVEALKNVATQLGR